MIAVASDTSPINYLVLVGAIDVLPQLFGEILIPPAVLAELQHQGTPKCVSDWAAALPRWMRVQTPSHVDSTIDLGKGETEAISLAIELGVKSVLMDEKRGRLAAKTRGLAPVGTLAILYAADENGLLDFEIAVEKLRKTSFRASAKIIDALVREVRSRRTAG